MPHLHAAPYPSCKIDTLPKNVLLLIFLHASKHIRYNSRKKPVSIIIARVCKKWRDMALHYPPMWTTIYFPMYPNAYILLYFERSRDEKIDFTLSRELHRHEKSKNLTRLAKTVKRNCNRIRSITIDDCGSTLVAKFFPPSRNAQVYPALRKLDVYIGSDGVGRDLDKPIIKSAPSLRVLKLKLMPLKGLPPFSQIIHFDITYYEESFYDIYFDDYSLKSLQDLYVACPNLKGLVLRNLGTDWGSHTYKKEDPVNAAHLESLAIEFRYASYSDISSYGCTCHYVGLTTPKLKYLELCNLPNTSQNLMKHMSKIVDSCTDASKLTVRLNCAQLSGCLEFLRGLPKSTTLELSHVIAHELPQVFAMSQFDRIILDLRSILEDEWSSESILPPDFAPASPVTLHIPLPASSDRLLLGYGLTDAGINILNNLPKDIEKKDEPLSEGILQPSSVEFFADEYRENYECDCGIPSEESSGETPRCRDTRWVDPEDVYAEYDP